VLSTYNSVISAYAAATFSQESVTLYGSARLGEYRPFEQDAGAKSLPAIADGCFFRKRGYVHYELTNHLGNVLATVSDRKLGFQNGETFYRSDVLSLQDYYAFGMEMPERKWNSGSYRYGFNGKEKSDEMYGEGSAYDFGNRINDPRIGRWLSLDPLAAKYSSMSPYCSMGNSPIFFIDPNGKEIWIHYRDERGKNVSVQLKEGLLYDKAGTLIEVNNNFVTDVVKSFEYDKEGDVNKIIDKISECQKSVHIYESVDETYTKGPTLFSPRTKIFYNPHGGSKIKKAVFLPNIFTGKDDIAFVDTGEKQTPAMGLLHEMGHVFEIFFHFKDFIKRLKMKDEDFPQIFDNKEEEHNIKIYEQPACKILHEPIRNTHKAEDFTTEGPTSTEEPSTSKVPN
jgi:RHS repeat-associated protein